MAPAIASLPHLEVMVLASSWTLLSALVGVEVGGDVGLTAADPAISRPEASKKLLVLSLRFASVSPQDRAPLIDLVCRFLRDSTSNVRRWTCRPELCKYPPHRAADTVLILFCPEHGLFNSDLLKRCFVPSSSSTSIIIHHHRHPLSVTCPLSSSSSTGFSLSCPE